MPKRLRVSCSRCWLIGAAWLLASLSMVPARASQEDTRLDPAMSLALDGEYAAALKHFERLIAEDPEDSRFHYFAGLCRLFLGDREVAVEQLSEAVKLKAAFPEAFYWLAKAYFETDRDAEACQTIQKGLEVFPSNKKLQVLAESAQLRCMAGEKAD